MIAKLSPLLLAGFLFTGCNQESPTSEDTSSATDLTPTGLTVVAMDSTTNILDVIAVPDDPASLTIEFEVSSDEAGLEVFALGERIHDQLPAGFVVTGMTEKAGGLGVVSAAIEEGTLVGIDGNGVRMGFEMNDQLKKDILKGLAAKERAPITSIIAGE